MFEALPGVAYPGVQDNRSTLNTKTGYDDMMMLKWQNGSLQCFDTVGWVTRRASGL